MTFCSDGPMPPPRIEIVFVVFVGACVIKCNKTDEVTIKRPTSRCRIAQGKSNHALHPAGSMAILPPNGARVDCQKVTVKLYFLQGRLTEDIKIVTTK